MAYFINPYRVQFHDTMAYGSHHHVTNFKFQNMARETLLFESRTVDGKGYQETLTDTVMLTRDAYSLNYAPVELGVRVITMLTFEAMTRSTVRLCFRTIREDGEPVSCGYQTMILIDKNTLNMIPAPEVITQYTDCSKPYDLSEVTEEGSFKEQFHGDKDPKKQIFSSDILGLAKYIFTLPRSESYPGIYDMNHDAHSIDLSLTAMDVDTGMANSTGSLLEHSDEKTAQTPDNKLNSGVISLVRGKASSIKKADPLKPK